MGIVFYPRGGSAQVVRYLSRALTERGHDVTVASGSLRGAEAGADSRSFYSGLPLLEVDYTEAIKGFDAGRDPMSPELAVPMHPSYEDKPGVPDRAFHKVGPQQLRALATSWRGVLSHAGARSSFHVLHLHHLNHLHSAALGQPSLRDAVKIAHLHGTELKMLEEMASGNVAGSWSALWREEMNRAAAGMDHFIAISPDNVRRAVELLGLPEESKPPGANRKGARPRPEGSLSSGPGGNPPTTPAGPAYISRVRALSRRQRPQFHACYNGQRAAPRPEIRCPPPPHPVKSSPLSLTTTTGPPSSLAFFSTPAGTTSCSRG